MLRRLLIASLFGLAALILGCGIVYGAVSQWTNLSSRWISAGFVFPLLGLTFGMYWFENEVVDCRTRFRLALIPISAVLATAGNYLAWVITSRTWFAERIPAEHQGFLFQLMNPKVLPSFFERGSSGSSSEQTWVAAIVVGLFAGPIAFWLMTRRD